MLNIKKGSKNVLQNLLPLIRYINKENLKGYDPYDALNSPYLKNSQNRFINLFFTNILRHSPVNFRKLMKIKKGINPKSVGLYLSAYCKLVRLGIFTDLSIPTILFNWLKKNTCKNYSGLCWGYNFSWQNYYRCLPSNTPTIVNTSFIGHSLIDFFEVSKDVKIIDSIKSCCKFIINDLNQYQDDDGICFSYTPLEDNVVHNANMLGMSFLSRAHKYTNDSEIIEYFRSSLKFSLSKQNSDGSWDYSLNIEKGNSRLQHDWHQGFIIDSLSHYVDSEDVLFAKECKLSIEQGLVFYRSLFDNKGAGFWRYPVKYPINIHNQAQGIITFSSSKAFSKSYYDFSKVILSYTNQNLMSDQNYYYYQKQKCNTNKIQYMRWNQSWMMLALATYIENTENNYEAINKE